MTLILFLAFLIWLYLLFLRGGYWRAEPIFRQDHHEPETWPAVVAIVPARDEADVVDRAVRSLLAQDYPGEFIVILVDDGSIDGTGDVVRRLSGDTRRRVTVIDGTPPPGHWNKDCAIAGRIFPQRNFIGSPMQTSTIQWTISVAWWRMGPLKGMILSR